MTVIGCSFALLGHAARDQRDPAYLSQRTVENRCFMLGETLVWHGTVGERTTIVAHSPIAAVRFTRVWRELGKGLPGEPAHQALVLNALGGSSIRMTDLDRPLQLITFDLYDTLIELDPPRWERLATILNWRDIEANVTALREADRIAEDYYTAENGKWPIRDRSKAERDAFRVEHMSRWLAAAGLPHDRATAQAVRAEYISEFEEVTDQRHYRVFPDVLPALERLRAAGLKTAVISNADADVTAFCTHFAFADQMDVIVTSALVGWEKPDPRTFQAAYEPLGVDPADALHIGDQPGSDVVGALNVGMRAALIDRYQRHSDATVLAVPTLLDLADRVLARQPDWVRTLSATSD